MFAVEMKQVCKLVPRSSGLKGGMSHLALGFVKAFLSAIRLHFLARSVYAKRDLIVLGWQLSLPGQRSFASIQCSYSAQVILFGRRK